MEITTEYQEQTNREIAEIKKEYNDTMLNRESKKLGDHVGKIKVSKDLFN